MQEKNDVQVDKFNSDLDLALMESSDQDIELRIQAILSILTTYLQDYIRSIVPEETLAEGQFAHIIFGLESPALPDEPKINYLSSEQKASITEAGRALFFIETFVFHPFALSYWPYLNRIQIKLYALSAHINKLQLNQTLKGIFTSFFEKILPLFPKDLSLDELGNFDPFTTYDDFWYETFLHEAQQEAIGGYEFEQLTEQLSNHNPGDILNYLLKLPVDSLTQFILIDALWDKNEVLQYQDEKFLPDWVNILKEHSNNGNSAAASWLVTAARHGIRIKDKIHSVLSQEEHLTAIRNTSFFPLMDLLSSYLPSDFISIIAVDGFDKLSEEKAMEYIDFIKSCDEGNPAITLGLLSAFMDKLASNRPDLVKINSQLKVEFAVRLQSLINEACNPLFSNCNQFQELIKESSDLVVKASTAEVKRNARLLAQGARTNSFFSTLPNELLEKIAADTRTSPFHSEEDADKIAKEHLGRPNLKG